MSDTIAKDATPHPRQGGASLHSSSSDSQSSSSLNVKSREESDSDDDQDIEKISRPHSRQLSGTTTATTTTTTTTTTNTATSRQEKEKISSGLPPLIFGHGKKTKKTKSSRNTANNDSDLSEPDDSEDSDSDDSDEGHGRRRRRRRRISDSASHLLAQAPALPDLRFDHNYRKALDQIYETHATETARAQELNARASSKSLKSVSKRKVHSVPSITARITVMTLRDIIIMPFIHGFIWGFGAIFLTLATQRTLTYHLQRSWRRIFGGNIDDVPLVARGEPARIRVSGGGNNRGLGGIGLMNAGSGINQPGFGRPSTRVY
ncbi:hypothetical protein BGZ76_002830 [Entomortierella beljakovae]|nr:hypothetical protein BGZ76_002830 [Entomortierella beljakovae]